MRKFSSFSAILAMVASLVSAGVFAEDVDENDGPAGSVMESDESSAPASAWPVRFDGDNATFVVYQPQFDTWDNNRLEGRAAVAVTKAGAEEPEFGVVWLSAQTQTDSSGVITIRDLAVGKADFPTIAGSSGDYVAALRNQLGVKSWQLTQERLQTDLEIDKAARKTGAQPVRNDVPQIVFSQQPAILVPIDGVPALRDVADTGLKRVVNTRALMLFDPVMARYYLYVSDHWMEAQKFEGPWTASANPPAKLEQAKQLAVQQNLVDLLEPDEEDGPLPRSPAIYVSTAPAELLQTDGQPQYAPIENTRLLYVTNSPNRIFLDTGTQAHYVLISGRWFRARNLSPRSGESGSWEYVSSVSLPGDFARIPADHTTESVRAAVAGTPQAREAAIENTVPRVATVTRSAASLTVNYDGDPSFQPIEGTSLQQAINSPIPVIRLRDNSFYALDNGVWFTATSPFGPWSVASGVPAVVYSIPRSSPLHYVTYVRIYDATPEVVYVGYTPGYVGSYVSSDNVVVYGTGWHYRPWIGSVWYSPPITWGFGFSFVHTWWRPWRPCCVTAWVPPPCFRPAWGPWHHRPIHRAVATSVTVNNNVIISQRNIRRPNVANIYNRWDRHAVARNRNVESPRHHAGSPGPGRGTITRSDGSRHHFGDGDRREWKGRDRSAQRRNDGIAPPIQAPRRRADGMQRPDSSDRAQSRADLPRIQGPGRRWERERDQNGQRTDRDRPSWQRRDGDRIGQQPSVVARPDGQGSDRNVVRPGRSDIVVPERREIARPGRGQGVPFERRDTVQRERRDTVQQDPRNLARQERRESARHDRRDFSERPQFRQDRPRLARQPCNLLRGFRRQRRPGRKYSGRCHKRAGPTQRLAPALNAMAVPRAARRAEVITEAANRDRVASGRKQGQDKPISVQSLRSRRSRLMILPVVVSGSDST